MIKHFAKNFYRLCQLAVIPWLVFGFIDVAQAQYQQTQQLTYDQWILNLPNQQLA